MNAPLACRLKTRRIIQVTALLLAALWPLAAQAGEARLWFVKPALAGALSDCPERAAEAVAARSADAQMLTTEAVLRWQGGRIELDGEARPFGQKKDLWDKCFALTVDDRVIVAGATLVPHSARLLRFPVLTVLSWRGDDKRLEFELNPAFPASKATVSEQDWLARLAKLQ